MNAAELAVLARACEALDRAEDAREAVDRDGVIVTNRYGAPAAHPGLDVERQNRALVGTLLRSLGILNPPTQPAYNPHKPGPKPVRRRP